MLFRGLLSRLVTLLVVLSVAVITTAASAHAARMGVVPDHAVQMGGQMGGMADRTGGAPTGTIPGGMPGAMTGAGDDASWCVGEGRCGAAEAGLCAFVCAGLPVFPIPPTMEAGQPFGPAGHAVAPAPGRLGRAPGLVERPPRLRLP